MSSMMVSRVPYAEAVVATETITPPGEPGMASGNGSDPKDRRRRFRRKGDAKAEERQLRPGEKARPGAYLDVLV